MLVPKETIEKFLWAENPKAHPFIVDKLIIIIDKLLKGKESWLESKPMAALKQLIRMYKKSLHGRLWLLEIETQDYNVVPVYVFDDSMTIWRTEYWLKEVLPWEDALSDLKDYDIENIEYKIVDKDHEFQWPMTSLVYHNDRFDLTLDIAFKHAIGEDCGRQAGKNKKTVKSI